MDERVAQKQLNDVVRFICERLPPGWQIYIEIRSGEAEIELLDPNCGIVSNDWDGDSHEIGVLLDYAISHKASL